MQGVPVEGVPKAGITLIQTLDGARDPALTSRSGACAVMNMAGTPQPSSAACCLVTRPSHAGRARSRSNLRSSARNASVSACVSDAGGGTPRRQEERERACESVEGRRRGAEEWSEMEQEGEQR